MTEGFVHTVNKNGIWVNKIEGEDEPLAAVMPTKQVAVAAGRDEAIRRKTEHVIHDEDGKIGERNSYGSNPVHRPGAVAAPASRRFRRGPTERWGIPLGAPELLRSLALCSSNERRLADVAGFSTRLRMGCQGSTSGPSAVYVGLSSCLTGVRSSPRR